MSRKKKWDVWAVSLAGSTAEGQRPRVCRVARDFDTMGEAKATAEFLTAAVAEHRADIAYEVEEQPAKAKK